MSDIKPQVYKDERPASYFDRFHARARKGVGWTYPLVRALVSLPTLLLYRTRAIGVKNVPKAGPVLLAPNHFSQMDHFFVGLYLRRQIRFMAKSQMFGPPVLTYIYTHGGVFPVRTRIRGAGGPGGDPRLGQCAPLEALPLSQGHRPVRRAGLLPGRGRAQPRAPARGGDRDLRPGARDVRGVGYS
jgi:1-acyl-sn-glycerol-3-phosphate acyltransferase